MKHTTKNLVFDNTHDDYGRFRTGWRVYEGAVYLWFDYLTAGQGYRDKTYKIPRERVDNHRIIPGYNKYESFIYGTDWDAEKPIWVGEPNQ